MTVSESISLFNVASITPGPDTSLEEPIVHSKGRQYIKESHMGPSPSTTPDTEIHGNNGFSTINISTINKRKCDVSSDDEHLNKKPKADGECLYLDSERQGHSQDSAEQSYGSINDFNFYPESHSPFQQSSPGNSRAGTSNHFGNAVSYGASIPNSRCTTPILSRGILPNLPPYIANLAKNDLIEQLSQQWKFDNANEAFLMENRSSTYLIKHNLINKVMRWLVINWMHQVAHEHRLKRQTFHLAVNYFDLYLSKDANFPPDSLFQLLGATALIAASKVEEEEPPLAETLCEFMLDPDNESMNAAILYDAKKKVADLEFKMFKKFGWEISFHTPHDFLLTYFQLIRLKRPEMPDENVDLNGHVDIDTFGLILACNIHATLFVKASNALADSVADYDCLKYSNSMLASSLFSLCYESDLNECLFQEITGYSQNVLCEAISFVSRYWNEASTDLNSDFPDYGDSSVQYDYIHHQGQTSKTSETMESFLEN